MDDKFEIKLEENTKTGVPRFNKSNRGILAPAMKYRFKMSVYGEHEWTEDDVLYIQQQTIKCEVDYKNHLIAFECRQPIFGDMQELIINLCYNGINRIQLDSLDGGSNIFYTIILNELSVEEHRTDYAYGSDDLVTHTLRCRYRTIETQNKITFS